MKPGLVLTEALQMTNPLIIEKPELQSTKQKFFFSLITLVFWVVWFYIWLPVVSLIAWLLGIDFFYEHMIILKGFEGLLSVIGWYATVIALSALTLVAWSAYNLFRFRNKNRRTSFAAVTAEELATDFELDAEAIRLCHEEKRVVISLGQDGQLIVSNQPPQQEMTS